MTRGANRSWRWRRLALAAGLLLIALAQAGAPAPARADAAPLSGLAGSDISPAQATNVRMTSEVVALELWRLSFPIADNPDAGEIEKLGAKVTADFVLNNPGAAEAMTVGFPLYLSLTPTARDVGHFEIKNLRAYVNGAEMATQRITVEGAEWAAWEMQFAPGDTQLRVTYELPATEDGCNSEFGYLIHTGALWAGTIGLADVIVRFGYPAEDMFVSPQGGLYLGPTTPGYTVQDFDVRWHFENFEPSEADDLAITFVTPSCWRTVLQARQDLAANKNAETYLGLARALADIVFPHHGFYGPAIAQAADVNYRQAIELDPENAELRQEYGFFLMDQQGWALTDAQIEAGSSLLTQIAPTPQGGVTAAPPASPTPAATSTEVAQVEPTATLTPEPTHLTGRITETPGPSPTLALATPEPAPRGLGCLTGALPALAVLGGGLAARRRRAKEVK